MSSRTPRDDEDALDPVEAADVLEDDSMETLDAELDEFAADADADEFATGSGSVDSDDTEEAAVEDEDAGGTTSTPGSTVAAATGATFDDEAAVDDEGEVDAPFDDEEPEVVRAVEDLDDSVEGLREGEFVCRSCYMAKRDTQLAEPTRQLCLDCA